MPTTKHKHLPWDEILLMSSDSSDSQSDRAKVWPSISNCNTAHSNFKVAKSAKPGPTGAKTAQKPVTRTDFRSPLDSKYIGKKLSAPQKVEVNKSVPKSVEPKQPETIKSTPKQSKSAASELKLSAPPKKPQSAEPLKDAENKQRETKQLPIQSKQQSKQDENKSGAKKPQDESKKTVKAPAQQPAKAAKVKQPGPEQATNQAMSSQKTPSPINSSSNEVSQTSTQPPQSNSPMQTALNQALAPPHGGAVSLQPATNFQMHVVKVPGIGKYMCMCMLCEDESAGSATANVMDVSNVTAAPKITAAADVMTVSNVTAAPKVTAAPSISAAPNATAAPNITAAPNVTAASAVTAVSGQSAHPNPQQSKQAPPQEAAQQPNTPLSPNANVSDQLETQESFDRDAAHDIATARVQSDIKDLCEKKSSPGKKPVETSRDPTDGSMPESMTLTKSQRKARRKRLAQQIKAAEAAQAAELASSMEQQENDGSPAAAPNLSNSPGPKPKPPMPNSSNSKPEPFVVDRAPDAASGNTSNVGCKKTASPQPLAPARKPQQPAAVHKSPAVRKSPAAHKPSFPFTKAELVEQYRDAKAHADKNSSASVEEAISAVAYAAFREQFHTTDKYV